MCRFPGHRLSVTLLCFFSLPAFAQLTAVESTSTRMGVQAHSCAANQGPGKAVQLQPYTAELKTTTIQVLSNGTTIRRESTEMRVRDSQNRSLTTRTVVRPMADQESVTRTHVTDPVENTETNWDSQSKTATVFKLPSKEDRHGCWEASSGNTRMNMNFGPLVHSETPMAKEQANVKPSPSANRPSPPSVEDLGTTTIEGVEAQGRRTIRVIPAGQIGNDKELAITQESWYACSLGLQLRSVNDNPQNGKTTMEVTRLDLSEPPLATFQPPEGYEVKTAEFHEVPCQEP